MKFECYLQSTPPAMADRAERGEEGNTKNLIPRERKELFTLNKKHFSSFFKGFLLVK